jgi:hypothetical protein
MRIRDPLRRSSLVFADCKWTAWPGQIHTDEYWHAKVGDSRWKVALADGRSEFLRVVLSGVKLMYTGNYSFDRDH